jgi:hypothetical protein
LEQPEMHLLLVRFFPQLADQRGFRPLERKALELAARGVWGLTETSTFAAEAAGLEWGRPHQRQETLVLAALAEILFLGVAQQG